MMADTEGMSETELIQYYFRGGFQYEEILLLLARRHGIKMSLSTLKRRQHSLALLRSGVQYDNARVRQAINEVLGGPGSSRGYRAVLHHLQISGIVVPRQVVMNLLREIDSNGVEERRARRLRRRIYHNLDPNNTWHCDGYDKLKPFGFPIHGCIDGWGRKIIWLYVTRSNNFPSNIAA